MGKGDLINIFPKLASDSLFSITSPIDAKYNCIAWAYGMHQDRWMWAYPCGFTTLDGVCLWWPDEPKKDNNISHYVEAFEKKGFELCDSYELEEGFLKIALYINPDNKQCLHAARQKLSGVWISKLGQSNDIEHGDPFVLEGKVYGLVHCCMKVKR